MSSSHKFLPYGRQCITRDDIEKMASVLDHDLITRGEKVKSFEEAVAAYVGAPYAVAFSNGSAALWAAYIAGDCQASDQVVTTPNTFVATASYPRLKGAKIYFADIEAATGNIDLDRLELPPHKTQGKLFVVPVHFSGVAIDMKRLEQQVNRPECIIIEDAAHAIGSIYPSGERVGSCSYSDMTIFSFHPVKNITTGEGGMVTTSSESLYKKLLMIRNSGIEREHLKNWSLPESGREPAEVAVGPWYYEAQIIACQSHMTEFQAMLGLSQLEKLDLFIAQRRMLLKHYLSCLRTLPAIIPLTSEADLERTAYHLFVVQIDFARFGTTRTKVMERLMDAAIGTQLHYVPLYRHPIFGCDIERQAKECPGMERYFAQALTLPLFPQMTTDDVEYVVQSLRAILFTMS